MSRISITDDERKILTVLAELAKNDSEGALCAYASEICSATGFSNWELNLSLLRRMRQRGLVDGNGARGKWEASFWISDKGKKALNGA